MENPYVIGFSIAFFDSDLLVAGPRTGGIEFPALIFKNNNMGDWADIDSCNPGQYTFGYHGD